MKTLKVIFVTSIFAKLLLWVFNYNIIVNNINYEYLINSYIWYSLLGIIFMFLVPFFNNIISKIILSLIFVLLPLNNLILEYGNVHIIPVLMKLLVFNIILWFFIPFPKKRGKNLNNNKNLLPVKVDAPTDAPIINSFNKPSIQNNLNSYNNNSNSILKLKDNLVDYHKINKEILYSYIKKFIDNENSILSKVNINNKIYNDLYVDEYENINVVTCFNYYIYKGNNISKYETRQITIKVLYLNNIELIINRNNFDFISNKYKDLNINYNLNHKIFFDGFVKKYYNIDPSLSNGLSENNIYLLFNNPEMIIHLIKELNNSENIFNKQLNFTF